MEPDDETLVERARSGDAARQETLSVELARRMMEYLCRAQHDPELRFAG